MDRYNSAFNSPILSDCSIMLQTLKVPTVNLIIWIFLGNKLDYFPNSHNLLKPIALFLYFRWETVGAIQYYFHFVIYIGLLPQSYSLEILLG